MKLSSLNSFIRDYVEMHSEFWRNILIKMYWLWPKISIFYQVLLCIIRIQKDWPCTYLNVRWLGVRPSDFFTAPCCESSSPSDLVPGSFSFSPCLRGGSERRISIDMRDAVECENVHSPKSTWFDVILPAVSPTVLLRVRNPECICVGRSSASWLSCILS